MNDAELVRTSKHFFVKDYTRALYTVKGAEAVSSPSLSQTGGSHSSGNSSEDTMLRAVVARQFLKEVTLEVLDEEEAEIIRERYIKHKTAVEASFDECMSTPSVYRVERRALIHWAYCWRGGVLLDDVKVG